MDAGMDAFQKYLIDRLQMLREAVLWKIDGVDDHDLRRPLTPTGTNLLGLVKHLATVEFGYFGNTFGRPAPVPMPWMETVWEDNGDMWASADESTDFIVDLYRRSWQHAAETFESSDLMTPGAVTWWPPERRDVTLGQIIVHMSIETARHAGHMDILREELDGAAGMYLTNDSLAFGEKDEQRAYVAKLQAIADEVTRTR